MGIPRMCSTVVVETVQLNKPNIIREISSGIFSSKIALGLLFSDTDFDSFYNKQCKIINASTLLEIKKIRKQYVLELESLNQVIKVNTLSLGMEKFLKGKRKFICMLLHHSKVKVKEINRFNNGGI